MTASPVTPHRHLRPHPWRHATALLGGMAVGLFELLALQRRRWQQGAMRRQGGHVR